MWSAVEFAGGLKAFHGRNKTTLIRAADRLYNNIGKSFSVALGVSLRQSAARILAKEHMTTAAMLEGHYRATRQRCKESGSDYLIVPQDTTYYNLTSHKAMQGVGPLQGKLTGVLQHNVLALDREGIPLGLLYQYNWTRGGAGHLTCESEKWHLGLERVNEVAGQTGKPLIVVQDREADMLSFLCAPRQQNVSVVTRLYQPRSLQAEGSPHYEKMQAVAATLPHSTATGVEVTRNNQDVTLALWVSWGTVKLKDATGKEQEVRLLRALETGAKNSKGEDVFDPDNRAEWILCCQLSAPLSFDAVEVIRWYSLRWRVERFHYVLKSGGLQAEKLQFDDAGTFVNALALYSVVALRVLQLTYAVREHGEQNANAYFSETELKVLGQKQNAAIHTLREAVVALAKLEGFAPGKRQPLPGAKLIGAALFRLQILTEGFLIAQNLSLQD